MSPYRPTFSEDSPLAGTALVRKMRSPHTTGLEWPKPGIAVFQRTFLPDSTFHSVGGRTGADAAGGGSTKLGQFVSVAPAARAARASR